MKASIQYIYCWFFEKLNKQTYICKSWIFYGYAEFFAANPAVQMLDTLSEKPIGLRTQRIVCWFWLTSNCPFVRNTFNKKRGRETWPVTTCQTTWAAFRKMYCGVFRCQAYRIDVGNVYKGKPIVHCTYRGNDGPWNIHRTCFTGYIFIYLM